MIFPKIKESIKHSEFFRRNNFIPEEFHSIYKKIKNDYINSKTKIKNKVKNDLVDFVNSFLVYNIDDIYLENYILDLINEFGFDDINEIIKNKNDNFFNKINDLNSIKLILNEKLTDINIGIFINEHCTPEYYIKNKINLDKNKLKNKRMIAFFDKIEDYNNLIKSKINIGNIDLNYKYLKYVENLDELFTCAIKNKNIKCAKKLLENGSEIHWNNEEAFRWSSANGHIEIVKFLIEKGADIHIYNDYALRWSSQNGHIDVVKFLIEKGADIHSDDDYALKWSSRNGHIDIVKFLIEKGANVHADEEYALRWSSINGHIELVKFLVKNGADIHAYEDYALRRSSSNGHVDVVKFLVENGANINALDNQALKFSSKNGHIEVVKFLIQSDLKYFINKKLTNKIIQKHRLNEFYKNLISD